MGKKIIRRRKLIVKGDKGDTNGVTTAIKGEGDIIHDKDKMADVVVEKIDRDETQLEKKTGAGKDDGGRVVKTTFKKLSRQEKNDLWTDFRQMIDCEMLQDTSKTSKGGVDLEETDKETETRGKKETETPPARRKTDQVACSSDGITEICLECLSDSLIEGSSGCFECTNCGVLSGQIIDSGAEWRFYGSEDNKSSDPTRCGMPANELLPESSLGSVVGYGWKGDSFEMHRIRKYQGWNAMPYKERARYNDFQIIQNTAARGGLPQCIIEDAKGQYKKITEDQISRGANRKGLRAACVYSACKKYNVPRSDKEIAEIFEIEDITIMTRACKLFQQIWNTHQKSTMKDIMMPASRPGDFIQRFCSKLGINTRCLELANKIASRAEEYGIVSENTPPSIAAGSIYLVVQLEKLPITKREIATACKISEVTICKCYKRLYKYRSHLIKE